MITPLSLCSWRPTSSRRARPKLPGRGPRDLPAHLADRDARPDRARGRVGTEMVRRSWSDRHRGVRRAPPRRRDLPPRHRPHRAAAAAGRGAAGRLNLSVRGRPDAPRHAYFPDGELLGGRRERRRILARADRLPHRGEGEHVLVRDLAGALPGRVLDLGCGDGRLTALVLDAYRNRLRPCVDMSPPMLAAARAFRRRRAGDVLHPRFRPPAPLRRAIRRRHHVARRPPCDDARKRALYAEIAQLLSPGGVFANLEIVASPTRALHDQLAGGDGRPRRPVRPAVRRWRRNSPRSRRPGSTTSTASGSGGASRSCGASDLTER